ncbi:hypothetical protein RND71_026246 [Anisodus tanguticus]|uniref:Uncharacterized protein n=1 Tax=Anisodus tanguticus TaxID=243964 RepID=A0AAE1V3M4_9SOLA|nr:hypothetical protein RND71_026246 [Anisodus tanguticus]
MKKGTSPKFSILILTVIFLASTVISCAALQSSCNPSAKIKGIKPPPGKCKIGYQSECCKPGKSYTTYKCSPPVTGKTKWEETESAQDSEATVATAEEVVDTAVQREEVVGRKVLLKRLKLRAEAEAVMQK